VVPWEPAAPQQPAAAAAAGEGAAAADEQPPAAASGEAPPPAGVQPPGEDAAEQGQAGGAAAAGAGQQQAGRPIKKLKLTVKPSGPYPAAAAAAAEATKVDDALSPEGGRSRPRRQPAATPAAAAGSSGGAGGASAGSSKGAKAAAGLGSADKIKSPGSAEKAERTAAAQLGARVKILWPKDKSFYSGEIVVGAPGCCDYLAVWHGLWARLGSQCDVQGSHGSHIACVAQQGSARVTAVAHALQAAATVGSSCQEVSLGLCNQCCASSFSWAAPSMHHGSLQCHAHDLHNAIPT